MICDSREIVKFGFSEKNTSYKKILYLGTHITQRSLDCGFYYFGVSNPFWSIIEGIYNSKELTECINQYKKALAKAKRTTIKNDSYRQNIIRKTSNERHQLIDCLQKHGIAINDIIGHCVCDGPRDDQIIKATPNDGKNGFHDVPKLMREADLIVINGVGKAKNYLDEYGFADLVDHRKIKTVIGSTAHGSNSEKIKQWLEKIGSIKKS